MIVVLGYKYFISTFSVKNLFGFSYMFVVLTLILYLLTKGYDADRIASLKKPIYIYIGGLTFSIVMMAIIGIYEVVSEGQQLVGNGALAGMSGLGHIAISIGLVWSIVKIFQYESAK